MNGGLRRLVVAVVALVAGAALAACNANAAAETLTVRTADGMLHGVLDGAVQRFNGIPYAQPPVGDLRWAPPRPAKPWSGVREARAYGHACAQDATRPFTPEHSAEDCLYLNVTVPNLGRGDRRKPVMVWIHGGGFTTGAGGQYDPRVLAAQGDVVVVTVNYRLGAFGFFAHPALGPAGTNFGLQDQIASLKWVRRNIGAFGGDPRNVTVFGQSAGAFSTCALATSPQAAGLLDKAILESGPCSGTFTKGLLAKDSSIAPGEPLQNVEALGVDAANRMGCGRGQAPEVLACLRGTPASRWTTGELPDEFSALTYGTPTLPEDMATAARTGRAARIPMIIGTTSQEWTLFTGQQPGFDVARYRALLRARFGPGAGRLAGLYPRNPAEKYSSAVQWGKLTSDEGFTCPAFHDALALGAPGRPAVFDYVFNDPNPPAGFGSDEFPIPPDFPLGSTHGAELPSVFGLGTFTPEQKRLSTFMIRYWSNFARSGDPNGAGLPSWDPVTADDGTMFRLSPGSALKPVDDVDAAHHCDVFARYGGK